MAVDFSAFVEQEKNLGIPIRWSRDGDSLVFVAPLETEGITIEGLQLRGRTKTFYPERDVTFQLEYQGLTHKAEPLARIDWRPFHTHNNKGRGPEKFRFKQQTGSHHHCFAENWNSVFNQMLKHNLPIALPIDPEPQGFVELLAVVRKEFRITDVGAIEPPQWAATLT